MTSPTARSSSIGTDLWEAAGVRGDAVAVRDGDRVITFTELREVADSVASTFRGAGLGHGDRVLVLSRSPIETLAVIIGAAQIGAVTVPANWRLSADEVAAVLVDSDARLILADADLLDAVRDTARPGGLVSFGAAHGVPAFAEWLAAAPPTAPSPGGGEMPAGQDVALQIYTSGTSGQPKGVELTHDNLAQKVVRMREEWGFGPGSTSLLATPLFHIGGLSWALIGLAAGATLIVPRKASTDALLETIDAAGVTHAFLVPKMLTDLTGAMLERGLRGSPLEVVLCGAAPVGAALQERAVELLGCRLLQVYGLTETTGAITQLDVGAALASTDPETALHSCGNPFPWVELAIRHPEAQTAVPDGSPGEIWTRSPQNCAGYWHRPAETDELLRDGWLRTGDGGFIDSSGRLHITDRIKDMIVSGGENIYSVEVEHALIKHPAVLDAAVIGLPDEDWGEVVLAVIEKHPDRHIDLQMAADHVGALLGRYKRPRGLVVVEHLPRNSNGKILKRAVRDLVAAQHREGPR